MIFEQNLMGRDVPAAEEDLLWRHLKSVPAFRALLRAIEARFYQQYTLEGPVLDMGCGDGHFAQMTFSHPLDVGIDPWWGPLQKARRGQMYNDVLQGFGDQMPFPDHTFSTVISNSVLEHIPDVQSVLNDISRVTQPGGRLLITMPSHLFTEYLGGAAMLERMRLDGLADNYRTFFNRISRHAHTDSAEVWAERLARAGFVVERWQYYFSREALQALEWGHVQGMPAAISHALTGHWILGPWESNLRRTERWVRPFYEEEAPAEGAYIFMVARKRADGPIAVQLPPAQPFTPAELAGGQPLPDAFVPSAPPPMIEPLAPSQVPATLPAVSPPPRPRRRRGDLLTPALVLLSLLLALLGQSAVSSQPDAPGGGLRLFGFALVALALALWQGWAARRGEGGLPTLADLRRIPRQRWLILPALLLVLLAPRPVADRPPDMQQPLLALLLWIAGMGLGFYALHHTGEGLHLWPRLKRTPRWELGLMFVLFYSAFTVRGFQLTQHPFIMNGTEANIGLEAWRIASGQARNPFATGWLTNPTLSLALLALPIKLFGRSVLAVRMWSPIVGALTVLATYLVGRRLWGREVGLVSAILLAGAHAHIHYARLGMTNIWDPLWVLVAVGMLIVARERGNRFGWLLAGLCVGLTPYWFTSAHLFPLLMPAGALIWAVADGDNLWAQRRHIFAGAALALLVALPQLLFYRQNLPIFLDRVNALGILQNGWLQQEAANQGVSLWAILGQQWRQAALAFNGSVDTSLSYNAGIPLLSTYPALFFVLGLGLALWQIRRPRHFWLLIWLLITIIGGGMLLLTPPASHRLLIALPAACLLAGSALVWIGERLGESFKLSRRGWTIAVAGLALIFAVSDVTFYFGQYRAEHRFGDRNSEIAARMSDYLNTIEGDDWTAYFYGAPAMYVDFPTIPFLSTEFQPDVNLFDVDEPGVPDTSLTAQNLVFIFVPERSLEVQEVEAAFPNGELTTFEGVYANPLFYAYKVHR
ncbi:MAG: glycosyltransferase family 39 protein [Ardenticatenales bacterium]|nr:glycosyltransferase family 39 protein [Ardenticatenales bacterium]